MTGFSRLGRIIVLILIGILLRVIFFSRSDGKSNRKTIIQDKDNQDERKNFKGAVPQKIDLFLIHAAAEHPSIPSAEAKRIFPRKYEAHGHVVVARLNDGVSLDQFTPFAEAFARAFLPVLIDVVLVDMKGIDGELRIPTLTTVYSAAKIDSSFVETSKRFILNRARESQSKGTSCCVSDEELELLLTNCFASDTMTLHIENGIRYSFDVRKVMFSSGNTTERMHFATVNAFNEVVVDMFAGIGYFTIPLARHGCPTQVHSLEKNPDSVLFLKLNVVQNRVSHIVKPQCGDNRIIGDELEGCADRVFMGYIPCCKGFLKRAVFFLKRNEDGNPLGLIHYHFLSGKTHAREVVLLHVKEELGDFLSRIVQIKDLRCVKSYAPKRMHFVADLSFA